MTGYDTETQFLNKEIAVWGEDYINDLIDKGYTPKLTSIGWRWIAPLSTDSDLTNRNVSATIYSVR